MKTFKGFISNWSGQEYYRISNLIRLRAEYINKDNPNKGVVIFGWFNECGENKRRCLFTGPEDSAYYYYESILEQCRADKEIDVQITKKHLHYDMASFDHH